MSMPRPRRTRCWRSCSTSVAVGVAARSGAWRPIALSRRTRAVEQRRQILGWNQLVGTDAMEDARAADRETDRGSGLRVGYFEDHHAVVFTEHEVIAHQLAADRLQQPAYRRRAVARLVDEAGNCLTGQRKENDE